MPIRITKPPREFVFDTLVVSASLVDPILAADRDAIGSRDVYDRAYYEAFFADAADAGAPPVGSDRGDRGGHHQGVGKGGKPSLADTPRPERRRRAATQP